MGDVRARCIRVRDAPPTRTSASLRGLSTAGGAA